MLLILMICNQIKIFFDLPFPFFFDKVSLGRISEFSREGDVYELKVSNRKWLQMSIKIAKNFLLHEYKTNTYIRIRQFDE